MINPMTDHDLDAGIAAAFAADTPPPPPVSNTVARAVRHKQERGASAWRRPRPAQMGWAAAGLFALVIGCAAGAASGSGGLPLDVDLAFGAPAATGDLNVG